MDVTVVIPNWNGGDRLTTLLKQLKDQSYPISQVLVVDNGSSDGSAEAAEHLNAKVVRLGVNRGFAAAVNVGVAECEAGSGALDHRCTDVERECVAELQLGAPADALA